MWECVTMIEAQEQLKLMNALDFPNMKKSQRQKIHKDLHRLAYPSSVKPKNYISIEDVQKMLGR